MVKRLFGPVWEKKEKSFSCRDHDDDVKWEMCARTCLFILAYRRLTGSTPVSESTGIDKYIMRTEPNEIARREADDDVQPIMRGRMLVHIMTGRIRAERYPRQRLLRLDAQLAPVEILRRVVEQIRDLARFGAQRLGQALGAV